MLVKQKSREVAVVPHWCRQHAAAAAEYHNHCQLSTSLPHLAYFCTHLVTRIGKPCHVWCMMKRQVTSHAAFGVKLLAKLDARRPTWCQATDQCHELDCAHRADCCANSCHDRSDVTSALYSCNISQTRMEQMYIKYNVTNHITCTLLVHLQ